MTKMHFIFRIQLPFFLDLRNDFEFKLQFSKKEAKHELTCRLDNRYWKNIFKNDNYITYFLIREDRMLDKKDFRPRPDLLKENNVSGQDFIWEKVKTVLLFEFRIEKEELLKDLFIFIKKEINRFLLEYLTQRLQNTYDKEKISPISESYYSMQNVELLENDKKLGWKHYEDKKIYFKYSIYKLL